MNAGKKSNALQMSAGKNRVHSKTSHKILWDCMHGWVPGVDQVLL